MKKQLLLISLALVSMFTFASNNPEDDGGKSTSAAAVKAESHVKIYKGLYLSMEDIEVENYIINELNGKPETNGDRNNFV